MAILLAPLLVVDVPPLLDYPNHLARAVVLAAATDPVLSKMYAANWAIIPNLATDLVLPPLFQVLPIYLTGRIVVGLILLLPVIGTIAYSRAAFGVTTAWPLASALVAYNATFLLGFLNFVAGCGIALLLAASWITWRDRHPARILACVTIGAVALFFCHLMGLLFFYLLIIGFELERLWLCRTQLSAVAVRSAVLLPPVILPVSLFLLSPLAFVADRTEFSSLPNKAWELVFPFANYILPLDVATGCLVAGFLLLCFGKHCCRVTAGSGLTLALTACLFLAAPWAFKGTYLLDTRFAIMLGFLLFGALRPSGLPRPVAHLACWTFAILFCARMSIVVVAWWGHQHDLTELRATIAPVEPGARVLAVSVVPEQAAEYWKRVPLSRRLSLGDQLDHHLPALLLIERRAYWPFLFDDPSQQPVKTLAPYDRLAKRADSFVNHRALNVPGRIDLCGFDYLLLLDAGGEPDLAHLGINRLALLAKSDMAALFTVTPTACRS